MRTLATILLLAVAGAVAAQAQAQGLAETPVVPPSVEATVIPAAATDPALAPGTPAPAPALKGPSFEAVWNNGLFFRTKEKDFSVHVGGALHYDGSWYSGGEAVQRFPGGVGQFNDGVNARRLRLFTEGTIYRDFDYKVEVEFMNGFSPAGLPGPVGVATISNSPGPTDAWIQMKDVPLLGTVRLGNQKEWFSLEHIENFRALKFMERSYLFDFAQATAFNNGFSPGVSAFRTWRDDRVFTAVGFYKNESDLLGFGLGDGNYAVTGRVASLLVWEPTDKLFWHVGGAMSHRDPVNGQVRVRVRNEVRNAPIPLLNLIADTGNVNADSQTLFNLETAAVYGPVTLSAEYTANLLNGVRKTPAAPSEGTIAYQGFYAEALCFLTGESRGWDPKIATYRRVAPNRNFSFRDGGLGAWEVGVRYTYLDLVDERANGGRLNDVTLGLTWYWNPNMRLQFNYDYLYRDNAPNALAKGSIHSAGLRVALDF